MTPEDFISVMLPCMLRYEKCPVTLKKYIMYVLYIGDWELMAASELVTRGRKRLYNE